jgi:hypothetical protein
LNLLSKVVVASATRADADFVASRQYVGERRGLLRPEQLIFLSPRAHETIRSNGIKGCSLDIAELA